MSWKDKISETRGQLRELSKVIPDATKGFGTLSKAVKKMAR